MKCPVMIQLDYVTAHTEGQSERPCGADVECVDPACSKKLGPSCELRCTEGHPVSPVAEVETA